VEDREEDTPTPEWIVALARAVKEVVPREFVGQIEVNLFRGVISNILVRRSYKDKQETRHG
jgi:hypothetical protein